MPEHKYKNSKKNFYLILVALSFVFSSAFTLSSRAQKQDRRIVSEASELEDDRSFIVRRKTLEVREEQVIPLKVSRRRRKRRTFRVISLAKKITVRVSTDSDLVKISNPLINGKKRKTRRRRRRNALERDPPRRDKRRRRQRNRGFRLSFPKRQAFINRFGSTGDPVIVTVTLRDEISGETRLIKFSLSI